MFPDIRKTESDFKYYVNLKRYLAFVTSIWQDGVTPDEDDLKEAQRQKNWFICKDKAKSVMDSAIEIERGVLSLLSYMELSEEDTVLRFYSKLDYLNKKNEAEIAAFEKHNK